MDENSPEQSNTFLIQVPAAAFSVLSPLVVAIRFWSRQQTKSALGSDDWTILCSVAFSLADCSVLLAACSFGFGRHFSTLSFDDRVMALKLFFCSQILYKISLNLTKVFILFLYLRAFTLPSFRIACWILILTVLGYGISSTVATILQCSPIFRAWDKSINGTCFDISAFWYANASYTIATDVILLMLPIRVVWGLQLRAAQKFAVLVVFALGGVVTVCSIIRMTTLAASATSTDPTYDVASTHWANIEGNIAILCACLPVFRRPLTLLFPRFYSPARDSSAATPPGQLRVEKHASSEKNTVPQDIGEQNHLWALNRGCAGDENFFNHIEYVENVEGELST